jgi:hypothetical protein
MAAAKRETRQDGYGEKLAVTIMGIDKARNRVEAATKDGAMIYAAVWETPTVFRWPAIGEKWTIRKDTGVWRLDQIFQSEQMERESEATPIPLDDLPEGDTRIQGNAVHLNRIILPSPPVVKGDTEGNTALKSLIKALDTLGFIVDETT